MEYIEPYEIALIQNAARQCPTDPAGKEEAISANIDRILTLIDHTVGSARSGVKVVVLPEYGINGAWEPRSFQEWLDTCVTIPSKWTDLLAAKARQYGLYLQANMFEVDPEWPGRFFNTSFIIDPKGEIVLKHWKHYNNANLMPYTTPADVYDAYVRKYGRENLFQVLKTPIGNFGALTCAEVMFPEMARCTTFNGAEILLHSTSEFQDEFTANHDSLKVTRAWENNVIFASANVGEFVAASRGRGASRGRSLIANFDGKIIAALAEGPGEATIRARVDIYALRHHRSKSFYCAIVRSEMTAEEYRHAIGWPNNAWLDKPIESMAETRALRFKLAQEYARRGFFALPEQQSPPQPAATR